MKVAFYVSRFPGETFPAPPSVQYLGGVLASRGLVAEDDILFAESPEEAVAFAPDIFGVSSVSQTIADAERAGQWVRAALPDCWTVLGGYHLSALPEALPRCFDLGVVGEGEETLTELVSLRRASGARDLQAWRGIRGLCFRDEQGGVARTGDRSLIERLDELPEPLYRLPYGRGWANLTSSRGCPYHCRYCASQSFWGRFRAHSAAYLVKQAVRLRNEFGVAGIHFVDDLFIAPLERLREFRRLLAAEGLLGRLAFKGFVRINLVTEEVVGILKEIGFAEIRFGMETASGRLLRQIKDQPFTLEKVEQVLEWCERVRLPVCASFMFGLPGEEESDLAATRQFLRKHRGRLCAAGCYLFQPVPGSDYWSEFAARGRVSAHMDFSTMQLDLTRSDLDWERLLYVNEERIPRARFRKLTAAFVAEFGRGPRGSLGAAAEPFRPWLESGKNAVRRVLACAGYEIRRLPRGPALAGADSGRRAGGGPRQGGRLYVGCGEDERPGYIGCDVRRLSTVAVVCPAWEVSRHLVEVEEVFSRHLLEHLTFAEAEAALRDWLCALKLDGELHLVVPDMDAHVRQWQRASWAEPHWRNPRSDARYAAAGFWGWQREASGRPPDRLACWDVHKSGYDADSLAFFLNRLGYWGVRCWTAGKYHLVAKATKILDPRECQVRPSLDLIEPAHRARYAFAAQRLPAGAKVLDLACGIGYGSYLLAERSACSEVHALDRNARALEYGARYYRSPKVRFTQVDIAQDVLPQAAYDVAVSFETLEHLPDARAFLRKLHGALKPGGLLTVSTPNQEMLPFRSRAFPFHVRHFTPDELRDLLAGAGLSVSGVWSQPQRESEQIIEGGSGLFLVVEARKATC
jgi:radical SAM superfamily enzyme YgiQ (UPF0313 family)/predicted SAM-dependent methyltransferase